ncbi:hypothetical protein DIPPA_52531 [Diplonema papillatum]|nr:hypothetical protein DIPPA_52531 [Diplonema papillatum]
MASPLRNVEVILQVDNVAVMEKGYKVYEGEFVIVTVPANTAEELATVQQGGNEGTQLAFGVCGDMRMPLTQQVKVRNCGRGQYHADAFDRELTFILPMDTSDELIQFVEDTLTSLTQFEVTAAKVLDRGVAPKHKAPAKQKLEEGKTMAPQIVSNFLASAREVRGRFFSDSKKLCLDTTTKQNSKLTVKQDGTGTIPESQAKCFFDFAALLNRKPVTDNMHCIGPVDPDSCHFSRNCNNDIT